MQFPIKYFEKNIIVNHAKDYWAIYKMKNFDYDFLPSDKKLEKLDNLTRFLANIGEEAKIIIVPALVKYNEYFDRLKSGLNEESRIHDVSLNHIEMAKQYVEHHYTNSVNDYNVYILTKINKNFNIDGMVDILQKALTEPVKTFNRWLNLDNGKISKDIIDNCKDKSDEYLKKQSRRMQMEEATEEDIQWLIKRSFFRGCKEEIQTWDDWKPYCLLNQKNELEVDDNEMVMTLTEGEIDLTESRMIKINHEKETSYQSYMCLTKIPDKILFPGYEFLMYSQQFNFPVETLISINNVDTKNALKKLEAKKRAINSQFEHIDKQNADIPEEVIDARYNLEGMETELKKNNMPLAKTSFTFCVYGNNKEMVNDRADSFMEFYKDSGFGIERTLSDQYKLFLESIPGTGRYNKNFILPVTPRLIAGGMIGATSDLGDNIGFYIGRGGALEKPVFLDLLHACQLNKPASGLVVGAQGYGKTFNTNLLVYNHILHWHGLAFIVDPKGDRKDWEKKLPHLKGHINIIELKASEEDKGKLDPFLIYREDMSKAGDLATNIITELFGIDEKGKTYLALQDAIDKVKQSENPCMHGLVEALKNCDETDDCKDSARLLSRKIANLSKGGLRNLLYSKGDVEALNLTKKINVVMIQNLKLPSNSNMNKEDYNPEEKLGTVLMLAIANFANNFAQLSNKIKKIIIMDEAWALAKTSQGQDLFERLARTGRSLNTSCIFIAHSANDITSEGIRNAIRYKFVFNVTNREEAIRTLDFLNMDITEDNVELLSSDERGLNNGECLFSDAYGRVGILKFDAVDENLVEAFKTTPPNQELEGVV